MTIWDAANPYRYAEVRGRVAGEVRGDEARAHIDTLSQRYLGIDYQAKIESERVVLRVEPVRQRSRGLRLRRTLRLRCERASASERAASTGLRGRGTQWSPS